MSKQLSSAMKEALMIIFMYEGELIEMETQRSHEWRVPGLKETSITLLSGRIIRTSINIKTLKALWKRGLSIQKGRRWSLLTPRLTKKGLYRIRQWPEYGELLALRTLEDL